MAWRDRWVDPWAEPAWVPSKTEDPGICYGVLWNRASNSPALQRIDENGDSLTLTSSDFNNHPIWGNIRRCTLTSAGVATYGENARGDGLDFTEDYCMVEIPGCYTGAYREGDYQGFLISDGPFASNKVVSEWHPAFWRRDRTGVKAPKLYIGAYESGANGGTTAANGMNMVYASNWTGLKLTSKSGVNLLTGKVSPVSGTISHFESAANLIGPYWGIQSFWTQVLLQQLLYIEFANFNSQTAIGPGVTNTSNVNPQKTGDGNDFMAVNGTGGGTDTQSVAYRSIENLWGNVNKYIIGFNSTNDGYLVMRRDGTGALTVPQTEENSEVSTGITPIKTNGSISDTLFVDPLKLAFIPSSVVGGSTSTYLTDSFLSRSITESVLSTGGWWNAENIAGIGYLSLYYAPNNPQSSIGARLEFIP